MLAAMTLASAGPAAGQDAVAPAPCDGKLALTDTKGDGSYFAPTPVGPDTVTAANHDVTGAFFTYKTIDGKPQLRGNIVVANLDTAPSETEYGTGVKYDLGFSTSDIYKVYASMIDGAWTYQFSYYDRPLGGAAPEIPEVGRPDPGQLVTVDTTGEVFPGPSGVISIDIPIDQVLDFKVGGKFTSISAHSLVAHADADTDLTAFYSDVAPDEGTMEWTVVECAAEAAAPTGTDPDNVGSGEVPAAPPSQTTQTEQPAAPQQQAQTQSGGATPAPAKPAKKSAAAKRKACQKKAKKIKNKKKRSAALKRCKKIK